MAMAPKPYLGLAALVVVVAICTSIVSLACAEEQNELLNDPRLANILSMVQGHQSSGERELLKFNSMKPQEDEGAAVAAPEVEGDDEEGSEKEEESGELDPVVQARFKQLEAALKGLTAPEVDSHEELDIQSLPLSGEGARGSDVISLLHEYARDLHKHQGDGNAEIESGETVNESDDDRDDEEHGNVEEGEADEENDAEPDPLVQARFAQLEEALRSLNTQKVDSHDELNTHGTPLSSEGMKGADVINLLHKYAQDLHQKLQANGEIESSHDHEETDQHPHRDEYEHANVESPIQYEAHEHQHEHAGHSHCSHSHYHHDHKREESNIKKKFRLPEEIAEEEDLMQYGFERKEAFSGVEHLSWLGKQDSGIWLRAMGCSLLVSLASLICLMLLPFIVSKGKPSETVVNALAAFGAGAMLGDALLHQLPHAFGSGSPPHSHDAHQHSHDHSHGHHHGHGRGQSPAEGHGHAHSLQDLSVGLAVLGGILLFFVVEKIVRRYEELSIHSGRGHSHHHHKRKKVSKEQEISQKIAESEDASGSDSKDTKLLESKSSDVKKRSKGGKKKDSDVSTAIEKTNQQQQHGESGGFVIGYLNLFSDAVHNFTDGMALGSAFLLHGTVGGWSRTLFLLAHEIPQEVGDFGILVKSGFSVFEALAFNFLSALVALAGTAMALMLGGSSGHSSLIEGFIAGGFIYMSIGGVIPSMHDQGNSLSSTLAQLVPMILGMGIAVVISLSE